MKYWFTKIMLRFNFDNTKYYKYYVLAPNSVIVLNVNLYHVYNAITMLYMFATIAYLYELLHINISFKYN